jgi:hypothetical protein
MLIHLYCDGADLVLRPNDLATLLEDLLEAISRHPDIISVIGPYDLNPMERQALSTDVIAGPQSCQHSQATKGLVAVDVERWLLALQDNAERLRDPVSEQLFELSVLQETKDSSMRQPVFQA